MNTHRKKKEKSIFNLEQHFCVTFQNFFVLGIYLTILLGVIHIQWFKTRASYVKKKLPPNFHQIFLDPFLTP